MAIEQEQLILDSWHENASPWINAISNNEIPNRVAVTNQAVVEAALNIGARDVLDVGCGEGWLARVLAAKGCKVTGVDAVPKLIEHAQSLNNSVHCNFTQLPFNQITTANINERFDLAICNFSLFGDESVRNLLISLQPLLTKNSHLLIQTLHPFNFPELSSGWKQGTWQGFSSGFTNPAPWYFRTSHDWGALLSELGYSDIDLQSPTQDGAKKPSSLLIKATWN
ncbi:MAG: class I SAM-dependent methyltransferase [Pseudohongiellaceae bacterium]